MDVSTLAPILVALIGAGATLITFRGKQSADKHAEEASRQDRLEDRVTALEARVDSEIQSRRAAERQAHTLALALEKAIDHIERLSVWVERGSPPPPPKVDLEALRAALRAK